MRMFLAASAAAGLLLAAGPALAQNAVTLTGLDLYGTMESVSIVADYSGDDNDDATGYVEYRLAGAGSFTTGHALVRLPGNRFAGSALYLEPDTAYDIRVVLDDPDNGAAEMMEAPVATRVDAPPAPGGGTDWWVDATNGDDMNAGDMGAPFATIQAAADAAGPGDTIHVLPGIYREEVNPPTGGSPGAPLWFVAEGSGVILDGSDETIASGATWNDMGGGLYWTDFTGASAYVAVDDDRIYDYGSLADLMAENGDIGMPGVFPGGFYVDAAASRLYLITPAHDDPAGHDVHVAVLGRAFLLDTITDVVIDGFEMRYYGIDSTTDVAVDVRDSARCWIRNNVMHHMNTGVRVRRSLASENVIEMNLFYDTSVYDWPWDSVKAHTAEASAVSVTHGFGNVVRWNDLSGSFNGVYTGAFGDADEEIARDTDIYENVLSLHGDDGLELEGAQRNVRYWENRITGVYNAISLAPVEAGPAFLVRNVIDGYKEHVLKVNNGTYGWVFIYHTTSVPLPGSSYPGAQAASPSIPFGAITTRNNLFEANRYVIEYIPTTFVGPVDWDWDNLWTQDTEGAGRFVKWLNVTYPDIGALAASGTIEANGFEILPEYEDAAAGDFTLIAGSGLLDVGITIAGINDAFIVGAGPDVGAYERGGIVPGPDGMGPPPPPDGGTGSDAGVGSDTGVPGSDAGADGSAGSDAGDGGGGGGCRCQLRGGESAPGGPVGFVLAVLAAIVIRRRVSRCGG